MTQYLDAAAADALMQANLASVFNEHDAVKRLAALERLWSDVGVLFEPDAIITGKAAISATVGALHGMLPPGTIFEATGPAAGHHDLYVLPWQARLPGEPAHTFGRDIAVIENSRITRLYVQLG